MIRCPVKDCGKEFTGNAGLSSHMRNAHQESIPENMLGDPKGRDTRLRLKRSFATPEAIAAEQASEHHAKAQSENAETESLDDRYRKLWAKGNYRCLECADLGKRVSFKKPFDLGRHRRFAHGIVGKMAEKNAKATKRHKEILLGQGPATLDTPGLYSCPHCPRTFTTTRGLHVHSAVHKGESTAIVPTPLKELHNGKVSGNRDAASDPAEIIAALAVSNATGFVQSFLLSTAAEHDLPPRQFARRCLVTLSKFYS